MRHPVGADDLFGVLGKALRYASFPAAATVQAHVVV